MGLFDPATWKEVFNPTPNPALGQNPSSIYNPQTENPLPADYKSEIRMTPISPEQMAKWQAALTPTTKEVWVTPRPGDGSGRTAPYKKTVTVPGGTPEEIEAAKAGLATAEKTADGGYAQRNVLEDPRYAGQAPLPSMRDLTSRAATAAIGQEGPRNALNYMRTAPTVDVGKNANRVGQTIDQSGVQLGQMLGLQDRMSQQDALGMQRMAAMGQAPSVAAIQQQQGLDAALSGQFALANSARGGVAQRAAAQSGAAMQAGQLQQAAVGQAAALRAGEMAQARGAYGDLAGTMRAGDLGQAGLAGQMATSQAGLYQQQQLANQGVVADARQTDAQLAAAQQLANQEGIRTQTVADDARMLGLISATQGADQMDINAQIAEEDARLRLLGLQSGVATDAQARGDRAVGGAMNAAGGVLNYFIPGSGAAMKAAS
jgi:hypothetical protein